VRSVAEIVKPEADAFDESGRKTSQYRANGPNMPLVPANPCATPRLLMNRAAQRRSIRTFRESSNVIATALCLLDIALFVATVGIVILAPNVFVKVLAALAAGLAIARLFVLGHDACHQSLFANRIVNRWIGRLVFLPSLTPFSLWEVGHNLGHHVYTNLRGMDYVWTPLSKQEFDALPRWRQLAERYYRSGWGYGAYYLVELWWKKLFFASRAQIANQRPVFTADSLLALGFGIAWIGVLIAAAITTQQSVVLLVATGFVVPFIVWNTVMGAVIYFHHTHPLLAWYSDIDRWEAARDTSPNTMHIEFRGKLGRIVNNIMEHPAHHLDVRIPLYRLEAAQRALGDPHLPQQRFSFQLVRDCISYCKLYDYEASRWTDFAGRPTGPALN
jgi:acyl-lipid omega-6 desaturase (Delta-12 desaturase)